MNEFREWIESVIKVWGGVAPASDRLGITASRLEAWTKKGSRPTLKQQYLLSLALEIPIATIREKCGLPWSTWAEWLTPLILDYGEVRAFCLKTEIPPTTMNCWLNCGSLPRMDLIAALPELLEEWSGGDQTAAELRQQMAIESTTAKRWRYNRQQKSQKRLQAEREKVCLEFARSGGSDRMAG